MKINVFQKTVTPRNGNKPFTKLITRLTTKKGTEVYCDVAISKDIDSPKKFPCVIVFDPQNANLSRKKTGEYTDENGEIKDYIRKTLWINKIDSIEKYVDHSLDDFV